MILSLEISIFDCKSMIMKGTYPLSTYEINMDAMSNTSSTFTINKNKNVSIGDYVAIKESSNNFGVLYYGQITTVDTTPDTNTASLTTNYIWNVLNGDILVNSISGSSYEQHILKLINGYVSSNKNTNIMSYSITNSTNTSFSVSSSDGITTSNFIDYLIRGFKLHNTYLNVSGIGEKQTGDNVIYYPELDFKQNTDLWNFKDDIYDFRDWQVTDSRYLRGYNNELWIVDKASNSIENPIILKKYWLQNDGSVVQSITNKVSLPTQVQIYIYDKTATDNPTYDNIASSNLSGNTYSHSIKFSTKIDNNFLPFKKIKLGLQSNIYYGDNVYKSILSAYSISSSSNLINLTFGNLRFGRQDLFGNNL